MGSTPETWDDIKAILDEEFACECRETVLRRRVCSNGVSQFARQCLRCGKVGVNLKKATTGFRERTEAVGVDEELRSGWWDRRWARQTELARPLQVSAQRERIASIRNVRAESLQQLDEYYRTERWAEKRRLCLARDKGWCQARMKGCTKKATDAHHLTYRHLGDEPIFELISVCRTCHDRITQMDRGRLEDAA